MWGPASSIAPLQGAQQECRSTFGRRPRAAADDVVDDDVVDDEEVEGDAPLLRRVDRGFDR